MKVTLKKDHTHAGQLHKAGTTIDVTAPEAEWLAAHEVIDASAGVPAKRAATEEK